MGTMAPLHKYEGLFVATFTQMDQMRQSCIPNISVCPWSVLECKLLYVACSYYVNIVRMYNIGKRNDNSYQ